ncbi:caspase-9 isoform X2 [Phyllobates terribilis]|uniref:caspase-9 isoform X2 n=1 Tax=Phyllobates terribilis TaxID=111132 RepID=UPI003CCB72FA
MAPRRVMTSCLRKWQTKTETADRGTGRMEQRHRHILQRNRVRLVTSLVLEDLWDRLLEKEVFSTDMVEEIQAAGTRRDQARQLLIDLQSRGSDAFHLFLQCLRGSGQHELADLLQETGGTREVKRPALLPPTPLPPTLPPKIPEHRDRFDETPKPLDMKTDYPMNFDPCGRCLIINNMAFSEASGLSYRTGSDIDREKLLRRLRSYHFDVTVKNNLKAAEIHAELQSLASAEHSERDCCLVVILSHGCETRHTRFPGGVFGTDGVRIPVERIVNYFNGSNCPGLRGKPKLFFIQACGGEEKDRGCAVDLGDSGERPRYPQTNSLQSDATAVPPDPTDADETDAQAILPTTSDILVSYSSYPGFVSWRETRSGSWYVENLDEVLAQCAGTCDLQSMLVMVADRVAVKGTYKQIPVYFNSLRKRFFFRTD